MAAPHVAGAAALAKARFPGATGVGEVAAAPLGGRGAARGLVQCGPVEREHGCPLRREPEVWIESPAQGFEARSDEPLPIRVLASRCGTPSGVSVQVDSNGLPVR